MREVLGIKFQGAGLRDENVDENEDDDEDDDEDENENEDEDLRLISFLFLLSLL